MRATVALSERIHAWLRTAILDVELLPGAPLAESEIAQRFDSSRTPVREALLRLADEHLVEIRPQRGTYVARLSLGRIEEAQFVRQAVEGAVIRRVCATGAYATVKQVLEPVLRRHATAAAADDAPGTLAADTLFHRSIVMASGLPGVWEVVARARDMHQRIRAIAVPELRSGSRALAEHRAVVRALAAGDAQAAEAAMARHLARNLDLARTIARRHPGYFEPEGPAAPLRFHDLNQRLRAAGGRALR
jgi:DNA-binding GntR family transcriptional regulator